MGFELAYQLANMPHFGHHRIVDGNYLLHAVVLLASGRKNQA
jgi:hypothetical protein